jgi:hypothetical protein
MERILSSLHRRVEKLPILLEELRLHLLNYDEVRNQLMDFCLDERRARNFKKLEEEIKAIEAIEKFITHLVMSGDCLFSNNLEEYDERILVPRTIEEKYFDFNWIYEELDRYGNIGKPFSLDIKYNLDLELFFTYFLNLDPYFHISPYESLVEYNRLRRAKYAVHSKRAFNKSETQSTLSSNEPELYDRKRLFNASRLLLEHIVDVSHKEQVNQAASKNSARFKNANEYVSNLFDQNGSLTFIALDLCFPLQYSDLESQKKYLKNFKNRIRNHSFFSKMLGYLGKWEYSKIKRVYVRMIFVFTKIEKHMLDTIPELIGSFWKNLSDDRSASFHYAYLSGGQSKLHATLCTISAKNEKLRQELERRTIYYLTHSQSYYLYKKFIPPIQKERMINEDGPSKKIRKSRSFEIFFKGELPEALVESKKALKMERKLKKEIRDRENAELQEIKNNFFALIDKY